MTHEIETSKRTFTSIQNDYKCIRFRRAKDAKGGFVLQGIPDEILKDVCARLFFINCRLIAHFKSEQSGLWALQFQATAEVAARLALLFPCPEGYIPLKIGGTDKKPVILYGKASDRAKFAKLQETATYEGKYLG